MLAASRRRSERRAYCGQAKIQYGIGSLPRDCRVVDISGGGIRMIAENLEIPAESILLSEGRRQCRLAWRIGCEFGAEFIDATAPQQTADALDRVTVLPAHAARVRGADSGDLIERF